MRSEQEVLSTIEACFADGEVETLVWREHGGGGTAVKVIHRPTGIEAESDKHPTQVRNKLQALLDLISRLLDNPSGQGA
jgi:protein subunit release factor A